MPSVSIIVPTLNEADNIDPLLERIFAVQHEHGLDLDVVFSDGASTDETCTRIRKWQSSYPVELVSHKVNQGLAEAVMAGARAAAGDYVVVLDADLSHPPESIPELLQPLVAGTHDMVIGSRYVRGGGTPDWPFTRKLSSKIATLPARFFTDAQDPLAGFFALRRERLATLNRSVCGFKIGLEILATAEPGLRVTEIPISFHDRYFGSSKMSGAVILDYFRQLLTLVGIRLLPEHGRFGFLLVFLLGALTDYSLLNVFLQNRVSPGSAHIYSFFIAVLLAGGLSSWLYLKQQETAEKDRFPEYLQGCIAIVLLTLFLRGGVFGTLLQQFGALPPGSLFLVVLTGVCSSYCGCVCFVFTARHRRINGELVRRFYGFGIVVYIVFLRFLYCGALDLLEEERYYLALAQQFQAGDVYLPHLSGLLVWFGTTLVGESEFGVRLGAFLFWFPVSVFVFVLARDMFDRTIAFRAVLLFAVLPYFFGIGMFMTGEVPLLVAWLGCLFYLYRALLVRVRSAWIWAGLFFGIGVLVNHSILLLLSGVVVLFLLDRYSRSWLVCKEPYLAMFLGGVVAGAGYLLGAGTGSVQPFHGSNWLQTLLSFSAAQSLSGMPVLFTPVALLAALYFCLYCKASGLEHKKLDSTGATLSCQFSLCLFLVPTIVAVLLNFLTELRLIFAGPVWLVLLPGMAVTLFPRSVATGQLLIVLHRAWWPTIILLLFLYGALLHYFTF